MPDLFNALEPFKELMHIINGLHGLHTIPSRSAFFGALGGYRGSDGVRPSGPTIDYELSKVLPETLHSGCCHNWSSNFLHHDLLFGKLPDGIQLVPTSSPTRIWRLTPQEYITKLNELINTESEYDTAKPGLRTHGDAVPTNHSGELKLYFGTDRIIKWQGGTVAYAISLKSVPVVLSSSRTHGFENYADFYSVNSAVATQTLSKAEGILRYLASGPLSIAKPEQITDDPNTYKMEGDIRGLPTSLVYSTKIVRPLTSVHDLMKKDTEITDEHPRAAVDYLFEALTFREPSVKESNDYLKIVKDSITKVGREDGVFMVLFGIFLHRDALFRTELAEGGKPDKYGRVMLQNGELVVIPALLRPI